MNIATVQRLDGVWYAIIHDGPKLKLTDSAAQQYESWLLKLRGRDVHASKKHEREEAEKARLEAEHMKAHNPLKRT